MKISVSVAWPAFLYADPETAFQANAGRLLRPGKVAEFERNFPAFKYQSETDRAKAMIERINAELAKQPLTGRWAR